MSKINYSEIILTFNKNHIKYNSNIDNDTYFNSINSINNCGKDDITFFSKIKYIENLKSIKAKACLIKQTFANYLPKTCEPIIVDDPYLAFATLTHLFFKTSNKSNGIISKNSHLDKDCKISKNVQIDHFSVIEKNTEIFENVIIGSNCKIGPNVKVSSNCIIYDNVSISNAVIMDYCEIKSGAIIGGAGFGFEEKTKRKIYHHGNVYIGKNSTIGSNTTIDRAVFDSTVIGDYSQIDNLVQIAHNVVLGKHSIIAAQVGIAGSTVIGDYVKIGGQAGIAGHLEILNNVTIAAKSGVTKNVGDNKIVAGFPAKDIKLWKKDIIETKKKYDFK